MALKNVQRYTLSLPVTIVQKLEVRIPKSKRSKFIAEIIEKELAKKNTRVTFEEIDNFWTQLNKKYPLKKPVTQSTEEMIREDRMSH